MSRGPSPRLVALAAGEKHYDGLPCVNCAGTRRRITTRQCIPCTDRRAADYVRKNPQKRRDHQLRHHYGIVGDDWDRMWASQAGCCAVCREPLRRGVGGAAVDHDHATGQVRALLCRACNTGLGLFRDSPTLLVAAAGYLEQHGTAVARSTHT